MPPKTLLTLLLLVTASLACPGHLTGRQSPSDQNPLILGNDPPADPSTVGFNLNHFALNVRDLNASLHFYGDILGMRHLFTFTATPRYTIVYMGHSSGGKNGTGFQTGAEMTRDQKNRQGMLELLHLKDESGQAVASTARLTTYAHIGMVVPDVRKVQDRMKAFGVPILKAVGEDVQPDGPVAEAYGVGADATFGDRSVAEELSVNIRMIGFQDFLCVADLDGNLLETMQQDV